MYACVFALSVLTCNNTVQVRREIKVGTRLELNPDFIFITGSNQPDGSPPHDGRGNRQLFKPTNTTSVKSARVKHAVIPG